MTDDTLFAKMMGKCWHEHHTYSTSRKDFKQHCSCGAILEDTELIPHLSEYNKPNWSPSPDGKRISYEVVDFMERKLPEAWELYLSKIEFEQGGIGGESDETLSMRILNAQLSLANLTQYIRQHQEMFYRECTCVNDEDDNYEWICPFCNGTGKIIKPGFEQVVEYLAKEGK